MPTFAVKLQQKVDMSNFENANARAPASSPPLRTWDFLETTLVVLIADGVFILAGGYALAVMLSKDELERYARHIVLLRQRAQRLQMIDVRMHPAIAHQAYKMQCLSRAPCRVKSCFQHLAAFQLAVAYCYIYTLKLLVHNASRAYIQVPHFRVAHLSFRQANVASTCAQFRARIIAVELVVKWSRREKGCITIFLLLPAAARIDAPAVANDKHHGTSHTSRTLPMNDKIDKRFFRLPHGICGRHRPPLQGT